MAMTWTEVESSHVAKVGYDEETQELRVEFKNGSIYSYSDVPVEVNNEFLEAESAGKYLNQHIIGHYAYSKVS